MTKILAAIIVIGFLVYAVGGMIDVCQKEDLHVVNTTLQGVE